MKDLQKGEGPSKCTWTPGKDVSPYITTTVMTKLADSDNQNSGVYRTRVRDDHSVVINMNPRRGGNDQCETWWAQGKNAPVAWVIRLGTPAQRQFNGPVFRRDPTCRSLFRRADRRTGRRPDRRRMARALMALSRRQREG